MKYVFFGTPRFAEIILDRLIIANMAPVALVCNPDRPVGRKGIITPPPTKTRAIQGDGSFIDILQPESFDAALIKRLEAFNADFFVVAAYAKIIPKKVLDIPRLGTLGVHPSPLPLYRGASPIQSVILHGEHETGTTIYLMDEKMDNGPILAAETIPLAPEKTTYQDLEEQLAERSAALLIKTIPAFLDGKITPKAQDAAKATFTKKFSTENGFIDEKDVHAAEQGDHKKAAEIVRKINALNPEPGTYMLHGGKRVKLLEAELKEKRLHLSRVQNEGGKPRAL